MTQRKLKKAELKGFTLTKKNIDDEGNYLAWVNLFYGDRLTYDTTRKVAMLDGSDINGITINSLLKEAAETRTTIDDNGDWKKLGLSKISRMKKAVMEVAKSHEVDTTDRIRNEIIKEYGDHLTFNVVKGVVCYDGRPNKFFIDKTVEEIKSKYNITSKQAKLLVEEVARMKSFKDVITVESVDVTDEGISEENWEDYLDREINENGEGIPRHTIDNYTRFLLYSPQFHNRLKYNSFDKTEYYIDDNGNEIYIDDSVVSMMKSRIEQYFDYDYKDKKANEAINVALSKRAYSPVIDYHNECRAMGWDGIPRAETFPIKFLGAKDTQLNRHQWMIMLLGSVCRVERETPTSGFFFDYMCILDGPQGIGKSKSIERLFGSTYTETSIDITNEQDYVDKCNKALVGVFEEMSKLSNKTLEDTKDFISKTGNTVRMPYARRSQYYPRHTVFFGNTNKQFYLRDYDTDYERRFLIIECFGEKHSRAWWEENLTQYYIDQVWAEVLHIYDSGDFSLELSDEDIEELKKIQLRKKTIYEDDAFVDKVKTVLNAKYPAAYCEDYYEWSSVFNRWGGAEGITQVNEIPCAWLARVLNDNRSKSLGIICRDSGFEKVNKGTKCYRNMAVWRRIEPILIQKTEEIVPNEVKNPKFCTINFGSKLESVESKSLI